MTGDHQRDPEIGDKELLDFVAARLGYARHLPATTSELLSVIRATLDQYGSQPFVPVPVTEMPWDKEGWCDAQGRCWFGWKRVEIDDELILWDNWGLCSPKEGKNAQISLPADSLPIPGGVRKVTPSVCLEELEID